MALESELYDFESRRTIENKMETVGSVEEIVCRLGLLRHAQNRRRLKPITAHAGQGLFQLIIDPIPHGFKGKANAAGPAAKMD